jgi:hypothetical protein
VRLRVSCGHRAVILSSSCRSLTNVGRNRGLPTPQPARPEATLKSIFPSRTPVFETPVIDSSPIRRRCGPIWHPHTSSPFVGGSRQIMCALETSNLSLFL